MTTRGRRPCSGIEYGDVVYVGEGEARRFGIWTGESFVQYASHGDGYSVHEISFHNFLSGAAKVSVCRFPARRNHEVLADAVIMAIECRHYPVRLLQMLEIIQRQLTYRLYSPWQTVRRAKDSIGPNDFAAGEDFALWCKTGLVKHGELETAGKILKKNFDCMKENQYFSRIKQMSMRKRRTR